MRPMLFARGADRRPFAPVRSILATTSAVAVAVLVAASLSAGSYALWADGVTTTVGSVTTGNTALSVSHAFSTTAWSNLLPGEKVRQPFTVTNSGTVAHSLSGSAVVAAAGYEVRAVEGTCPAVALSGASATVTPVALGTIASGATRTMCLEVALTAAATPGSSTAFTFTVAGSQVP